MIGHEAGDGHCSAISGDGDHAGLTVSKNRTDGSVEVMLQGSPEQLASMCTWLGEGMSAALVDELEVVELQPPFVCFDHFERLPTL